MSMCSFGLGGPKSHVTIPHSMRVLSTQETFSHHSLIHPLVISFLLSFPFVLEVYFS